MLQLCTKESPFVAPDGQIYKQVDGVAMGPTFSNFYMGEVEQRVLNNDNLNNDNIKLYCRYVDDCFLVIKNQDEIIKLKNKFENNSVLKFTFENSIENKLPFLDIMINKTSNRLITTVYHKPTDIGQCLNFNSECILKYKLSVINNYLNRAYNTSQNWESFHNEINHIKQVLVNNNYTNTIIDQQINKFLNHKIEKSNNTQNSTYLDIYHKNQTHTNSKIDEKTLKEIIMTNVKCINQNQNIRIIFYYKNMKTSNFVIKNSPQKPPSQNQTNGVYQFTCELPHVENNQYIGMTTCKLNRRMQYHS